LERVRLQLESNKSFSWIHMGILATMATNWEHRRHQR